MKPLRSLRPVVAVVAAILFLGPLVAPMAMPDLLPSAEAATSRDKRKISKLKKTVKKLKRKLIIARRPVPPPAPFLEMVTVGNVGNAADQNFGDGPFGAVNYEYSIGTYEVSLAQYAVFLNAVAASDPNGLYHPSMETDLNIAGILRSGSDGSFTYAVIGSGDRPVTYVSWFDAARFCNWLHNGRPTGVQDATTTERGAYTLDGVTSGGSGITRNPGARSWIPSEDEWYKAAYHQPSGQGGDSDDYWLYPTASNTVPGNVIGALPLANHANYFDGSGYSVTQSDSLDAMQNYLTNGGAYEGSPGPYGTFDQGGNVWEWNDEVISGSFRGVRGGSWSYSESSLRSSNRDYGLPGIDYGDFGFRVAGP